MAVAWFRNPVLDQAAPIVDRNAVNEATFGRSMAKRYPRYVYSVSKNACLMHKVIRVEIHWYAMLGSSRLGRLKQPAMIAHTACGVGRILTPDRSRTCAVPLDGSELCGRCHGEGTTFRRVSGSRSREWAQNTYVDARPAAAGNGGDGPASS